MIGELDTQKISKALGEIKNSPIFSTLKYRVKSGNIGGSSSSSISSGRSGSSSSNSGSSSSSGTTNNPKNINDAVFGLLLWGTKACFNLKAEPAMAIYEMQYDQQVTTVFVEIEEC